jgi:hypothetical protein
MNNNDNEFEYENPAVNHPDHYNKSDSGVETIKIARYFDFDCGNALKYLMRFRYKQKPREDLEKAIWYLKDKYYNTALTVSVDRLNHNIEVPFNEEVYQFIRAVVRTETNIYVRNALTLIAEYATFGAPVFVEPYAVICELEDHIDDILKEERSVQLVEQANQMMEDAGKLFAAVVESDNKETPKETWEKSKQTGVLQSLIHNRKSVFDDPKSESNTVDAESERIVDLLIDNKTGKAIPPGVEIGRGTIIQHVPFMLNEQSYKELKEAHKDDVEFRAAAYNYAANIYEVEHKDVSPVEAKPLEDSHKNWVNYNSSEKEATPETPTKKRRTRKTKS